MPSNRIFEEEYNKELGINYKEVADRVINAALDYEKCPYEAEISLTLTDNESIHEINKEFREIDRPTDVLSFPMVDYEEAGDFDFLESADEYFNMRLEDWLNADNFNFAHDVVGIVQNADRTKFPAEFSRFLPRFAGK